jgi:Kef-type K+ transport system membrane component KefB
LSAQGLSYPLVIALLGIIIVVTLWIRSGLTRIGLPPLVGFMIFGLLIRMIDTKAHFLSADVQEILNFLADVGVIILLFRVGMESNLKGLLRQIRHASIIWTGDVLLSGLLGFAAVYYVLGFSFIPSLFVGIALTATSVGVSISVWEEVNATRSPTGELLLDVAEMDDVSGVVLLALLLALAPQLRGGFSGGIGRAVAGTTSIVLAKLLAYAAFCVLFSLYIEKHVTRLFSKLKRAPDPMLLVAGIGFIIAAAAGLLGFSLAMGAFFAGLVFSRDPKAVRLNSPFGGLHDLFVPFFFLSIGLGINPADLTPSFALGAALCLVAILGKLIGDGSLSLALTTRKSAILFSLSMIPRAEIALIVMKKGLQLGDWAVPGRVFSAMAMVSVVTCILSPIVLRELLNRWKPGERRPVE